MHRGLLLILSVFSSVTAAASTTEIFFPSELVGGKVRLFSSGARVFTGNGWAKGESGKTLLQLEWVDKKNDLRMFHIYWSVDVPDGRFRLGAERKGERIVFTLTREGETQALLRSEPHDIETWQRVNVSNRNEANHSPDPTPASVTPAAGQPPRQP